MYLEIVEAGKFLARFLQDHVDQDLLSRFQEELAEVLEQRFCGHWDPKQPYRGNGYRAITNFDDMLDPVIAAAAQNVRLPTTLVQSHLPRDLVLWIDPFSVSYRIGDHGNIMTLFEDRSRGRISLKPDRSNKKKSYNSSPLQYIQQRTTVPIRISPPTSPDNKNMSKKEVHQASPLAKHPVLVN
ncbi:hypothetical protein DFQ28_000621 [Apophysomyces sp. BC1034]|nr:hypothetical protein DFQ30_006767 [Apophysomyces sp. BC1015]KAG0180835.1 hypothetical protein DFQ29_010036 [Apophysomyces sp. BC1021]KAG0191282.1 hypothetical protein DFQ28_000621 [Apophysomyces sp. BC1034]